MRSFYVLFFLFLTPALANSLPSYYPNDFKESLNNGLQDQELKKALFKILSQGHVQSTSGDTLVENCSGQANCVEHINLGYSGARKIMFGRIHLEQTRDGYAVRDVYCQILYKESDFKKDPPGPDQIPDGRLINTEHSWPQSHFSKKFPNDLQKSDLNILFPTDSKANTSRSNLELANVSNESSSPCKDAKRGYIDHEGRQTYFEPPNEQKGASARAILYFSVRYKMPISAVEEAALKQWNRAYPVSNFERDRNDQVFQAQHNRNPFIDDPGLVDRISDF